MQTIMIIQYINMYEIHSVSILITETEAEPPYNINGTFIYSRSVLKKSSGQICNECMQSYTKPDASIEIPSTTSVLFPLQDHSWLNLQCSEAFHGDEPEAI